MKIFSFPTFNVLKVLATAEELALGFEFVLLDPSKGEHKTPEHLARHPLGKVPAIEHDGEYLYESNAICRYLAVISDSKMYAGTPRQRAIIDQYVDLMTHHVGRWLSVYFFEESIKPRLLKQEASTEAVAEAAGFLKDQLPVIDNSLEADVFLGGDQITIADTVAYAYFSIQESTTVNIENYSNITRWYEAMRQRPAIQRAHAHLPS